MNINLSASTKVIKGTVHLDGSKSISNRVLIIQALCQQKFQITGLSTSDDTKTLKKLLGEHGTLDTGHAGTTYRFMTAFLSLQNGEQTLVGSERMHERPIGALVDALRQLGADIDYIENQGFPPLKIKSFQEDLYNSEISISGNISSQYLSALALIAPTLPDGLVINIEGELVSKPYLQMTLSMMEYFGVLHTWNEDKITVKAQTYQAKDFVVEADWSAASYYYSIAGLAKELDIQLIGLSKNSLQGDAVIQEIARELGIKSTWNDNVLTIQKDKSTSKIKVFEYNFESCPDIAQTVAVWCAGANIEAIFSGLKTLKIKETDRINALQNELQKFNVFFTKLPERFSSKSKKEYYMLNGDFQASPQFIPIETYKDHRMAMSFAPLALKTKLTIMNANVVSKSYPDFWRDLESIGFDEEVS